MNDKKPGVGEPLLTYLSKIQQSMAYEDFCEMLGKAVYEKICSEEITDYKFGAYIVEAILTNDADKVFGAFTGLSAETFMRKYLLVPDESAKGAEERQEATYYTLWDGDILLESDCMVNLNTRQITDIDQVGINADSLDVLEEEYIMLDDVKVPACNKNDLDEGDIYTFWYE